MEAEECLRLNKQKRPFPGSNHAGSEHQKKPVTLSVHRAFDLSMQNEQLVAQERVFRQQFGSASGQIDECTNHEGSRSWFDPSQNTFLKRMQARCETRCLIKRNTHHTNRTSSLGKWTHSQSAHAEWTVLIVRASHVPWQESLLRRPQQADFLNGCPK